MRYAKGGVIPGKVDFTAENGERIIPIKELQRALEIHKEHCDKWVNERESILWTPKHSNDMTEFRIELTAHNIAWEDNTDEIMIRTRFWVEDGEESWSAICGKWSMGGTDGLIEVWNPADDEPSGGYTIDEVMEMVEKARTSDG